MVDKETNCDIMFSINNYGTIRPVIPAVEWGEKPREWVTVMPPKEDKSDTLRRFLYPAYTGVEWILYFIRTALKAVRFFVCFFYFSSTTIVGPTVSEFERYGSCTL